MNQQQFKKGMMLLVSSFPGTVFNMQVFEDLLSDVDGIDFLHATKVIVQEVTEAFPSTNFIAMIRAHAAENRKVRIYKSKKITKALTSDPPGPEWEALKKQLGCKSVEPKK